ncbi:MerR family transcriptional regulator [Acrocarpospora catenulata]|uniref:MerR family transcriptional regulator n=1 Tax=Acrocarpospora catenulata TaxID=2836182 RepID=UPI001BD9C94E|nr:MerR family transcriptional regulator [Acrocarpospora catenulata]
MRIGELAAAVGVSPRALRYYEEQGLLRPDRTPTGHRVYPESAIERVHLIRLLLAAGLASRTIIDILPCLATGTIASAQLEMLKTEQVRIDSQIRSLERARERLADLISTSVVRDQAS